MKHSEEEVLGAIGRVLRGESEAFLIIYQNYAPLVLSVLKRVLRAPRWEIEGLANEVFLQIHRSLKNFKGRSKFSTYIYPIIVNRAFKEAKKRRNHRQIFAPSDKKSIEEIAQNFDVELPIIEKLLLEEALSRLPRDLMEALDLFYYGGCSIREIAGLCGTSENTIKSRLFQAKEKIRAHMPKGVLYAP